MKTDARVRYTRKVLKESLLKLLKEKPVNKISVKEVCELAELNRATFYAHYADCFDLLNSIEQELIDAFEKSLRDVKTFDVSTLIEGIYAMVEQHEDACRELIFKGASPALLRRMVDTAREPTIASWKQQLHHASDTDIEMLYTHLSNGLMNVVVGGYDKYQRKDVIRFVNQMVRSSLSEFR